MIIFIGETNEAFDECLLKNDQQPILRSTVQQTVPNGQRTTSVR